MIAGDQARATVSVAVAPAEAFRIFTEEIDQWWRRGVRFRNAGRRRGVVHLEGGTGGRIYESFDTAAGPRVVETGRVTVWEPPSRLVLEWRIANFAPGESTEVEVIFAPTASGTMVTVTHRGWSKIRADHPARHGQAVVAFLRAMAMWWGDLLTSVRAHAAPAA